MSVDSEDKSIGGVTWHSSEDSGPPDVGISVYLAPGERLWAGEISKSLFDETGGPLHFDSDGGWFLVRHKSADSELIAKFPDEIVAQAFMEQIGAWVRAANRASPADPTSAELARP